MYPKLFSTLRTYRRKDDFCFLFLLVVSGYCTASFLPYYNLKTPADIHLKTNGFNLAHSCLDYLRLGRSNNGFYLLWDNSQRYLAYCDFASEPGSAWTLVMSWSLRHRYLPHFYRKPFVKDAPINHKTPNWELYRQTLSQMKSIRSRSTHWRATCLFNYFHYGSQFSYRDYLRGKFSDLDIMTWSGSACKPVDYVNIREHSAYDGQTVPIIQVSWQALHIDSSHTNCDLKANNGAVHEEGNFGFYGTINNKFRCTRDNNATTQWWFGGYLGEQ